jgi:hypothetical protein
MASTFVIWVAGLTASALFFKKARRYFVEARYVLFTLAMFAGTVFGIVSLLQNSQKANAVVPLSILEGPNQPMGQGIGIHPGRVVWTYNPNATDETCTNSRGDYWSRTTTPTRIR